MTYEKFNEARDLDQEMCELLELEAVIENSSSHSGRYLAAITDCEFQDARNVVISKCRVLNHLKIPAEMKKQFLDIIHKEHDRLYQEFLNL